MLTPELERQRQPITEPVTDFTEDRRKIARPFLVLLLGKATRDAGIGPATQCGPTQDGTSAFAVEGAVRDREDDIVSLCYTPEGGSLVETCTRTMQGRLLLRPSKEANDLILGVLGRAIEYAEVELFAFSFLSSHYHALYWVDHALQMARFQNYLNSNLARELGRHYNWREKFWGRRYRPMVVSNEKDAQWARLEYILGNGVGTLVDSPLDWPGANAAKALVHDEPLVGHWFDRTKEWEARRRGRSFEKHDFATRYEIQLGQLPAFQDLSSEDYRQKVADLIRKIEKVNSHAKTEDSQTLAEDSVRRSVMGADRVQAQNPHTRPRTIKKSPAPKLFFAADPAKRNRMRDDYDAFEANYYLAANRLCKLAMLSGSENPAHEFPTGCFPRAMPFQGAPPLPMPRTPPTRLIVRTGEGDAETVTRYEVPTVRVPRGPDDAVDRLRASPAAA